MISVVVIDDEALVRQGFTLILGAAPDLHVVGTGDGTQALALIERTNPDVVLLDLRMPGTDGLAVLRALRAGRSQTKVVILTTFDSDEHVADAMLLGASGFLLKDTDPESLPQYVRTAAAGGIVLAPSAGRVLVAAQERDRGDPKSLELIRLLSTRELAVLRLMAEGSTNGEIAVLMHLSVGTIKDHVSAVLGKLGVTTRVQAALCAERAGIL